MKQLSKNTLYYGDNLTILREYIPDESIDLIYLDPPFNSNRNYNILYKNITGQEVPDQVQAFCDTWTLDAQKQQLVRDMPVIIKKSGYPEELAAFWENFIEALRKTQPKLLAYLVYMTVRLIEMKRVLKPTGSLYYHCDPTASHYIKIILDGIFGHKNFRNEIVWCYKKWNIKQSQFCKNHDLLLFYSANPKHMFFEHPYIPKSNKTSSGNKTIQSIFDENGKRKSIYLDQLSKGAPCPDWWEISIVNPMAKERLGYPIQKPKALLDRIIKASCPEGGVVLDPFCGCGTTIAAAHLNNHDWIGIDIAILSVQLVKTRVLEERYSMKQGASYQIHGIPVTSEQAKTLFESDPFQFEHWAIETAGGFCNSEQRGDKGIDGHIYFRKHPKHPWQRMLLSVKGGKNLNPSMIRDLSGTMDREKTQMAGLICLHNPTKGMLTETASKGQVELFGQTYDQIQILTVETMLQYKKDNKPVFNYPVYTMKNTTYSRQEGLGF